MILATWTGFNRISFATDEADSAPTFVVNGTTYTGSAVTATGLTQIGTIDCEAGRGVLTVGSDSKSVLVHSDTFTNDTVRFGSVSCCVAQRHLPALLALKGKHPDVWFAMGDFPYTDSDKTAFADGPTATDSDETDDQQNFLNHHIHMRSHPDVQALSDAAPVMYMWDDHEWAGGDWDHSLIHANFNRSITAHANLTDMVTDHWYPGMLAASKFMETNVDSPATTPEFPGAIADDATASTNLAGEEGTYFPVRYFKFTRGPVEFFVLDCKSYMDPTATGTSDSDFINSLASTGHPEITTTGKQMLGANQYAWLTAQLSASTAPFKGIMTCKQFMNGNALNTDEWRFYAWQRDALLDYIDSNSITGVFFVTGDDHCAAVEMGWKSSANAPLGADTTTYDLVMVNGCPSGTDGTFIDLNRTGSASDYERLRDPSLAPVVYFATATSERVDHSLVLWNGKTVWKGYQLAGENFIRYEDDNL